MHYGGISWIIARKNSEDTEGKEKDPQDRKPPPILPGRRLQKPVQDEGGDNSNSTGRRKTPPVEKGKVEKGIGVPESGRREESREIQKIGRANRSFSNLPEIFRLFFPLRFFPLFFPFSVFFTS